MYELIILSMLMQYPVHGFLIVKIINDIVGPIARASNGRIYPLLAKLAADGLVEVHEETTSENGLPMRIYRITASGRQRFHDLMLDVDSHPREYRELFAMKVVALPLLPREERAFIIERYISFSRAHIRHMSGEITAFQEQGPKVAMPAIVAATLACMEHMRQQWELELQWALDLRAWEAGGSGGAPVHSDLIAALNELMAAIAHEVTLSEAEKDEYLAAAATLKQQLGQPRPVRTVLMGTLRALRDALGASPGAHVSLGAVWSLAEQRFGAATAGS